MITDMAKHLRHSMTRERVGHHRGMLDQLLDLAADEIDKLRAQLAAHRWHRCEDELPSPGGVLVETYSEIAGHGHDIFTLGDEWHSGNHDGHEYWRHSPFPAPEQGVSDASNRS